MSWTQLNSGIAPASWDFSTWSGVYGVDSPLNWPSVRCRPSLVRGLNSPYVYLFGGSARVSEIVVSDFWRFNMVRHVLFHLFFCVLHLCAFASEKKAPSKKIKKKIKKKNTPSEKINARKNRRKPKSSFCFGPTRQNQTKTNKKHKTCTVKIVNNAAKFIFFKKFGFCLLRFVTVVCQNPRSSNLSTLFSLFRQVDNGRCLAAGRKATQPPVSVFRVFLTPTRFLALVIEE